MRNSFSLRAAWRCLAQSKSQWPTTVELSLHRQVNSPCRTHCADFHWYDNDDNGAIRWWSCYLRCTHCVSVGKSGSICELNTIFDISSGKFKWFNQKTFFFIAASRTRTPNLSQSKRSFNVGIAFQFLAHTRRACDSTAFRWDSKQRKNWRTWLEHMEGISIRQLSHLLQLKLPDASAQLPCR